MAQNEVVLDGELSLLLAYDGDVMFDICLDGECGIVMKVYDEIPKNYGRITWNGVFITIS